MAKMMRDDILSMYGKDAGAKQVARATCGGDMTDCIKPLPYSPPVGPTAMMKNSPGLHGTNHGNCGTQGRR